MKERVLRKAGNYPIIYLLLHVTLSHLSGRYLNFLCSQWAEDPLFSNTSKSLRNIQTGTFFVHHSKAASHGYIYFPICLLQTIIHACCMHSTWIIVTYYCTVMKTDSKVNKLLNFLGGIKSDCSVRMVFESFTCCTYGVNAQQEEKGRLKRGLFEESRGVKGQVGEYWWSYLPKWLQDIENSLALVREERRDVP